MVVIAAPTDEDRAKAARMTHHVTLVCGCGWSGIIIGSETWLNSPAAAVLITATGDDHELAAHRDYHGTVVASDVLPLTPPDELDGNHPPDDALLHMLGGDR